MRATYLLVVVTATVWAFSPACRGDGESSATEAPPANDAATAAAESPVASPTAESYSGQPVDALLIEWKTTGGELTPLDAALRAAAAPMPLVQAGSATASPDGSRVVVSDTKRLALFRVDPWQNAGQVGGISEPLYGIGQALAWAEGSGRLFTLQYGNLLREVDTATDSRRQVASVDFSSWSFAAVHGGESLLVLAYESAEPYAENVSRVFLALVDSATGDVGAQVDLPGVTLGQRKGKANGQEYYALYWPALTVSPDGRRAYLAHSDSEAVTVVDLDRMAVEKTVTLREPRSRWERLASAVSSIFVSRAEAKGGLFFRREAVVSHDGRWLYVTGTVARPCGYNACEVDEPAGLWVVDAKTLRVVHRETGVNHIALSPGGELVAATGRSVADGKGTIGRGVKLIRSGTWEFVAHFEPESAVRSAVFSRDGSRLLTLTPASGLDNAPYHDSRCIQACYLLRALDVKTGRVVASREAFGYFAELVSLAAVRQ